jgi:hypothetical protein|nr:MAG TPA: chromosome segregation ATPase [Caudoviricetes sp.]
MERPAFSAGEVGIDVVPLTDRFFAELKAKLHDLRDLTVPVEFDPDDMAASRTYEKWNGRDARVNVSYDVDMSGLRELSKQDERLRKRYEKPVKPVFDGSGVVKGLDMAIGRVEQLRKVQKNVGDVFTKNLGVFGKTETSRLKEQMLLLDRSEERMRRVRADRDELVSMRGDEWNQLNRQILGNMSTLDALQKRYDELGSEISKVASYRDSLRDGGRRDEAKAQTVRLRELRAEYRATARNMREVTNETNRLARQQDRLKSDSVAKWIHDLDKQLVELDSHTKSVRKTFDSVARSGFFKSSDMGKTNVLSGVSFFGKDLNRQLNAERAARKEQERLNDSWRDGAEWQGNLLEGTARYARNLKTASNVMNTYGKGVKEANRLLDEQEQRLAGLQKALRGVNKYGRYSEVNKQLNDQLAAVNRLRKQIESNPIKTRLVLDDSRFNRKFANVTHQVGELTKKLERENELRIRVDFWTDTADALEERLRRLQHGRIRIPADIVVDNENLIERARQVAEEVRRNPDRKVELEADLDLDMKRAEKRIKDFQKANDTFNMDVDLETAAARAHLAYFTRPRTVDIFAEFKGTDLGKIMKGMTAGATGVRGVQNEWQKLVNVFDKFDEVVPKWSLLGAVFASVGAGALNLSRTAGSAGASLVMMGKAALAAPGALLGLAAGYEVAYAAANKFGAYVDVSTTKLGGLHDELADTFWKQAATPVTDMMNALGDSKYVENMNGVADAEGRIVANAARVVAQEPYVDRINSILGNTVKGVDALDPGVQAVTASVVRLGDRTSSYLPRMANYVSRNATLMAQWVDEAERTDKVNQAMEKAIEQGGYLMSSVKSVGGILKGTFGTLAEGENGIEKFSDALSRADRAVNGVKFQATLSAWADGAKQASGKFHDSFREVGDAAYELRDTTKQVFVDSGSMVSTGIGSMSSMLGKSKTGITDFSNGVSEGFQKVFRAVDSAAPMFDSLLSMGGKLSDTFGGTLGNTLKSAAPTIKVLADGASTMAQAFGKLPAPVQAMVGMYATFGKAGISAYNSLKRGMLQNIESTLQYRKTLSQLGITSQETAISMSELVRAMARLKSGQTAGVLTGEVSNIRQMGAAADETTAKLNRMNRAQAGGSTVTGVATGAGSTGLVRSVGEAAEGATRKTGLLKTALSGVVDFLGGPVGIAIGGATTALSLAGSAISSYNDAAAHTQTVNRTVADSFKNVQSGAADASTAVSKAKKTVSKNWTDKDYGWKLPSGNAIEKGLSGITKWVSPFKDSSKAADALGISVKQLNSAATGTNDAYDEMHKKLEAIKNDQQWVMGANGQMVNANEQQAEAAERLLGVLEDSHTEWVKGMKVASDWIGSADSVANVSALASNKLNLLSESLAANNYELEGNSKNAQTNRKMMADYANSALLAAKNIIYAGNGTAEANQKAKNAVYSARQEIIQMAEQCGMSAEAAAALADQMGLIPDNVSTKFDLTNMDSVKAQVQDYIDQLELTKGQKEIILDLVQQGDITSFDQLAGAVKALMGGASKKDLVILLDAQDNASDKIKNATALAKGFGLTKAEINILAKDEAGPKLDAVKQKLRDSGLTDAQIQILIDALDKASGKMQDIEKRKVPAAKGVRFDIDANDDDANVKLAKYQGLNGSTLATAHTFVIGDDSSARNAFDNTRAYDGVTLAQPWGRVLGEHSLASLAFAAIQAFNGVTISRPWGRVLGDNESARNAFRDTRAYDGVTISRPWGRVLGDASDAQSVFRSISALDGTVLATRYVDVVTRKSGDGSARAATGGRISGPGTGTSDSIPMWLSNGEHVIRAASASKLDRTVGPNFLNVLNATGDLDRAVSQARTSYARSAVDMSRSAYAAGGRVEKMMSGLYEVNVQVPDSSRELVSAVNELRREVAGFRDGIGGEISRNSSPWPSKRDFVRDVLEASRGR